VQADQQLRRGLGAQWTMGRRERQRIDVVAEHATLIVSRPVRWILP